MKTKAHNSIIVQIPALKKQRRNDLEKALSVFEVGKVQEVSINEDDYPERYKTVIRQLLRAIADNNIRKTMDIEDEILEDLEKKERLISRQQQELAEKDEMIKKLLDELNKLKKR
jgi:hypothetical protein